MADIESVVSAYKDLLIIQYHGKPKAQATIELFVRELLASGLALDVLNGYNIDTAVGKQLDVIGKYVGTDRFFQGQNLVDLFAMTRYTEVAPDAEAKWGFDQYSTFGEAYYNGTLTYDKLLSLDFALTDEDYRVILKLKIVQNASNHSHKSIDDGIFKFFGTTVIPDSTGDMHMLYFIPSSITAVLQAAIAKKVLPKPIGVGLGFISYDEPIFGFALYSGYSPFITGFTTYADYATMPGELLTYEQIIYGG